MISYLTCLMYQIEIKYNSIENGLVVGKCGTPSRIGEMTDRRTQCQECATMDTFR